MGCNSHRHRKDLVTDGVLLGRWFLYLRAIEPYLDLCILYSKIYLGLPVFPNNLRGRAYSLARRKLGQRPVRAGRLDQEIVSSIVDRQSYLILGEEDQTTEARGVKKTHGLSIVSTRSSFVSWNNWLWALAYDFAQGEVL